MWSCERKGIMFSSRKTCLPRETQAVLRREASPGRDFGRFPFLRWWSQNLEGQKCRQLESEVWECFHGTAHCISPLFSLAPAPPRPPRELSSSHSDPEDLAVGYHNSRPVDRKSKLREELRIREAQAYAHLVQQVAVRARS